MIKSRTHLSNTYIIPTIFAVIALLLVILTTGLYGHTWDEALYYAGAKASVKWLYELVISWDISLLSPQSIALSRGSVLDGNDPLHPEVSPLPKLITGFGTLFLDDHQNPMFLMRLPIAIAFAMSVFMLARLGIQHIGSYLPGVIYMFLPRVFGHAHIAASETLSVFFVLLLTTYILSTKRTNIFILACCIAALFLTKITLVSVLVPLFLWTAICTTRQQTFRFIVASGLSLLLTFALYPVFWHESFSQLSEYTNFYMQHQRTAVFFLSQKFGYVYNQTAPWYYAVVIFCLSLPAVLLPFFILGSCSIFKQSSAIMKLFFFMFLIPILLTMIPNAPRYDGERLFLVAFPFAAIIIAYGVKRFSVLCAIAFSCSLTGRRVLAIATTLLIILFCAYYTVTDSPTQLDYYNSLIGGHRGATKHGFETTYWGQSLNRETLSWINQNLEQNATLQPLAFEILALRNLQSWGNLRDDIIIEDTNISHNKNTYCILQCRQGFWNRGEQRLHFTHRPVFALESKDGTPFCEVFRTPQDASLRQQP